jgi:AAHS family benzoate transporter-like MFS transporter
VLFVLTFITGVGLIGSQVLVDVFMATHYPDDLRGPGINWALAVGRLGALLGPAIGGWIIASQLDMHWNFYLFAIPGVVGAIAAALMPTIRPPAPIPGPKGVIDVEVSLSQALAGSRHMLALWTPSRLRTPG